LYYYGGEIEKFQQSYEVKLLILTTTGCFTLYIINANMWKEFQNLCSLCVLNNIGAVWGRKQTQDRTTGQALSRENQGHLKKI